MKKHFKKLILILPVALVVFGLSGCGNSGQNKSQNSPELTQNQKSPAIQKSQEENAVEEQAPKKIDTSNWKTYRNEEYGFEVKYPSELTRVSEYRSGEYKDSVFAVILGQETGGILLRVQDKRFDLNNIRGINDTIIDKKHVKEKTYNKLKMYSYATGDAGCEGNVFYIPNKDTTLVVSIIDCINDKAKIRPEEDKILKSIKLLN